MFRLALTGISSNPLRSWLVAGCALLVAAMVLSTVLISRGGEESLRLARERLGAEHVVVVPRGSVTGIEGALLLGNATNTYMPRGVVEKVAAVPGVEVASPQLYLMSMSNSSCCSVPDMFMVAYDPATDFTIEPWLRKELGRDLTLGESVGGTYIFVPEGAETIKLYGYDLSLEGNLEPTGSNLDATIFFTFETAYEMARSRRPRPPSCSTPRPTRSPRSSSR